MYINNICWVWTTTNTHKQSSRKREKESRACVQIVRVTAIYLSIYLVAESDRWRRRRPAIGSALSVANLQLFLAGNLWFRL